jgi:hypothetical protein
MTPPRIVETPNHPFDNSTPDDLFISPHFKKWDPIGDGRREETPVDKEDFTHMIPGGLNRLLKRQGEQNERDMQDILGHTERKAKKEAKERLLSRQSEQRSRQAFKMLQDPGNKQKLRCPHVLTPVPMGLPLTLAERPCNRCGEESTYEHRQNCPAKAPAQPAPAQNTCTNCKKKGHRAVICHNGKRLNANGQVASASATPESGAT